MPAPAILRSVFQELNRHWGRDDDGYVFESDGSQPLERVDVVVYRANDTTPMTTFATIGMASRRLPEGGFAELHCSIRGRLAGDHESAIAVQLANLAGFSWGPAERGLAWGHTVGLGRDFPGFPGCDTVFVTGPFVSDGWDVIETPEGMVRILNIVPITAEERARARTMLPGFFIEELMKETDIFAPRT